MDTRLKASISTYPWDLADEGIDRALDNIQDRAGLTDVSLAMSYHVSTYFLPHNPVRQLYYGEDGMLLFEPDPSRYRGTEIEPRISEVVDGPGYLWTQTERIKERGLGLTAWVVYAYNHHLARKYPEYAKQDALGNRYLSQLSVSHPDVRAYFLAVTADILSRCGPNAIILESLGFREFEYGLVNPKINSKITPWCQFLMGLCMSDQSVTAASSQDFDGETFRADVAGYLRETLKRIPTKQAMEERPTEERIADAFNGRLQQFVDSRLEVATSLMEETIALVKSHGDIEILTAHLGTGHDPVTGLSAPRLEHLVDYQYVPPVSEAIPGQAAANDAGLLLNVDPTAFDSRQELESTVVTCLDGGADGVNIYNYGLVHEEYLDWVGGLRSIWQ